jgi:hypothetical protein
MRYIKLENNTPVDYSIEQLFEDYPNAVIYKISKMPNEKLLAKYNVYPLITTPKPKTLDDEAVEESIPELRDNSWYQTWKVRKLTETEIQEIIETKILALDNTKTTLEDEEDIRFIADKEIQEKRYEICKVCKHFTALKTCKECGCIMPLKVKLFDAKCPIGKW